MRPLFLLCLTLFVPFALFAQSAPTEAGLKLQQQFIEAKREALLGNTDKAIGMFRELADAAPADDAIQFELGRLHHAAGNTDEAVDALRQAYGSRPNEVYAAFLAKLYQESGRYREGAELYAQLVKSQPGVPEHYLEQAAFLVRAQDIKGAISVYDDLQKRVGINPELARHKHALYLGSGDQKRAERELTELVDAFPRQLEYRHLLAAYYVSQNDRRAAESVYREILRREPDDVRAQLALQAGSPGGGSSTDTEATMALLARPDVDVDLKIGRLLPLVQKVAGTQDAGLAKEALALAAELRRVHPDEAKAAALEGDLLFHSGRYTEAGRAYRATVELDDTVFPVWEQLLATLYLNNESADLREYAEQALDIFPNRPSIYVHYALGEAMRADYDEAESLLDQALLMVSANAAAKARILDIQEAISDTAGGNPIGEGNPIDQLPGGLDGPLARMNELRARGSAPELAELRPLDHAANTNALFLELLGDAQLKAGEKEAAAATYQRARAAGSKSPTLSKKIVRIKS